MSFYDRVWREAADELGATCKTLASGGVDRTICLWKVNGGRPDTTPRRLTGHKESVQAVIFSADGESVISGGWGLAGRETMAMTSAANRTKHMEIAIITSPILGSNFEKGDLLVNLNDDTETYLVQQVARNFTPRLGHTSAVVRGKYGT